MGGGGGSGGEGGVRLGGGRGGGGQGGCYRRIEVFGKIYKKKNSGGVWGVGFGLGGQGSFCENSKKIKNKNFFLGGGGSGLGGGHGGCE